MSGKNQCVDRLLHRLARVSPPSRTRARRPRGLRPSTEPLEPRWALDGSSTTYTWTALGDKTSFDDPNNWTHVGNLGVGVPGLPTIGSNISFPPISWLPAGSPTTINFNLPAVNYPVNIFEIGDSYTFTGNGVTANAGIIVANPGYGKPTAASILLSGVKMGPKATIYTQQGSTLTLGSATNLTGVQFTLQGGVIKQGGGQLVLDTQSITDPRIGFSLQTFEVAGGTLTLGTSTDFSNSLFQVDANAGLNVADGAAVKVGSLSGAGTVMLQGTGAAGDQTGLTAFTPVSEADVLSAPIDGHGQFTMQGHGTLTIGGINFASTGAVNVVFGTLDVNGPISAGTLTVTAGTFGGLGSWHFSGPVTFQPGSSLAVTLDGLAPGTQYPQLVSSDQTTGINLGGATLTGAVGYEYQAGDSFTIAAAPTVQGTFGDAAGGIVLLGGTILFAVGQSGTSATLTALQSETTTRLSSSGSPSHPGQPVTFTAAVSTRTAPVTAGTVSLITGGTTLATVPVAADGTASVTTTSLPLGVSTLTAVYNGATNVVGSTSAPLTQTVVPYSTVTTVSTSINPSRFRQAVTMTATVTADGRPVTSGTVTFTRGNQLIGAASLGPDGTASVTTAALPRGDVRIQAAFGGNTDNDGSVSPAYFQVVDRAETVTSLAASSASIRGGLRTVLTATVEAVGEVGINPVGQVVFRREGRTIGRVEVVGGTARLVLPIRRRGTVVLVASFRGNPRFGPSDSPSLPLST